MSELSIRLFGRFEVRLDNVEAGPFESNKVRVLLAFLALEPAHPHSRGTLAGLLWPTLPERRARRNLSQALYNLRQALRMAESPTPCVLATPRHVGWNPASTCVPDVIAFLRKVEPPDAPASALEQALGLYGEGLLPDGLPCDSPAWEEWLAGRREALRRRAVDVCARLVEDHNGAERYDDAARFARWQCDLAPWMESAHQALILALDRDGRSDEALAHFEQCRRLLAEEIGVAPSEETLQLAERIRQGRRGRSQRAAPPPAGRSDLPFVPTPFVGREQEQQALVERLRSTECRLLTLLGPGGVGKTRLALEVARRLAPEFEGGVVFVPLETLESGAELPGAILRRLLGGGTGRRPPMEQLKAGLGERSILLILDNFEHLAAEAPLVGELVQACPPLKVLVTSRGRLHLPAEWAWPLAGLEVPPAGTPPAELAAYSSVKLWVQRAAQAVGGWKLTPADAPAVREICAAVEGMPLAIELAAAWVRALPCEEIARELRGGGTLLTAPIPDRPDGGTLATVFDRSWRLLEPEARRVLAALSIFRDGFRRAAANEVAQTELGTLLALADHSLLRLSPDGRYSLHPLVREDAALRLEARGNRGVVAERHSRYYAAWIGAQARVAGRPTAALLDQIGREAANIRAAWLQAAAHRRGETVLSGLAIVARYYAQRGPFEAGERLFSRLAAAALTGPAPDPRLHGRALALQARFAAYQSRYDEAIALAARSEAVAHRLQDEGLQAAARLERGAALLGQGAFDEAASTLAGVVGAAEHDTAGLALQFLGTISSIQGEYERARDRYEQALIRFRAAGDRVGESRVLNNLGIAAKNQGAYPAARAYYERGLVYFRELDDQQGISRVLNNLGVVYRVLGDVSAAASAHREALDLKRRLGDRRGESHALTNLGNAMAALGDYEAARRYHEGALRLHRRLGQVRDEAVALSNLALLSHLAGDQEGARERARAALDLARTHGDRVTEAFALTHLGHAYLALARPGPAESAYRAAHEIRVTLGEPHLATEALAGLLRVDLARGQIGEAARRAAQILDALDRHDTSGVEEPLRLLLSCYEALHAAGDPRAPALIRQAHEQLQRRAGAIPDPSARRRFLQEVATHQAIVDHWRAAAPPADLDSLD